MYMPNPQSFIEIGGQISEKKSNGTQRDIHLSLLGFNQVQRGLRKFLISIELKNG